MYIVYIQDRGRHKVYISNAIGNRREHVAVMGWIQHDPATAAFDRFDFWFKGLGVLDDLEEGGVISRPSRGKLIREVNTRYPLPRAGEAKAVRQAADVVTQRAMAAEGAWTGEHESAAAWKVASEWRPDFAWHPVTNADRIATLHIAVKIAALRSQAELPMTEAEEALLGLSEEDLQARRGYWTGLARGWPATIGVRAAKRLIDREQAEFATTVGDLIGALEAQVPDWRAVLPAEKSLVPA